VVFDQDVLVLMDKSDLVVSHLDVAPGHHTEVPVDQVEPGHVYQPDAVGETENKKVTPSVVLQQLYLCYVIKQYHRT
jgi:hypothetical protein